MPNEVIRQKSQSVGYKDTIEQAAKYNENG